MPNGNGVVYEKEVFHNGNVGAASAAVSDYGGTRSGCDAAGALCNNDGTKAELWWASATGSASPTRLNRANGRNSSGTLEIPTGNTNTTCKVGTMLLHREQRMLFQPLFGQRFARRLHDVCGHQTLRRQYVFGGHRV